MDETQLDDLCLVLEAILPKDSSKKYVELWLRQYSALGVDVGNIRRYANAVANMELKPTLAIQVTEAMLAFYGQPRRLTGLPRRSSPGLSSTLATHSLGANGTHGTLQSYEHTPAHIATFLVLIDKLRGELLQSASVADDLVQLLIKKQTSVSSAKDRLELSDIRALAHEVYLAVVTELGPYQADMLMAKGLQLCAAHQPTLRLNARELL